MKLNLGCGRDIRKGYVNYDIKSHFTEDLEEVDICGNCEEGLPFKDETFEKVIASHILEHIHDLRALKHELWRVMKPDAELVVTVPDYQSPDAWGDDTHCRAFSVQSFFWDFWPGFWVFNVHETFMTKQNSQKVTWLVAHIKKEANHA